MRIVKILFFLFLFLSTVDCRLSTIYAESVTIDQLPELPAGTFLFEHEKMFGLRGKTGGFALKPDRYGVFRDRKVFFPEAERPEGQKPASTRIMYLKSGKKSFCGTYIILLANVSDYSTLTFMIKGRQGGESFEIGINDTISNKREDAVIVGSVYRYLPDGITRDWQMVSIPLDDFFGSDMSRVYSLVFHFNETGKGIFWMDDLRFHTEYLVAREDDIVRQGYLLLDDFDHNDLNLLGRKANTYKKLPSVCEAARTQEVRVGEKGRSLKLVHNKESTGWCGYYTLLNQIGGEYYDLTKYKSVSFMVKGDVGGENFQLGMADKNWINIGDSLKAGQVENFLPGGVTTEWKEVVIPLDRFGSLDLTQMGSFVIDFNKKQKGAVYIDNLKFILKTKEELLAEW